MLAWNIDSSNFYEFYLELTTNIAYIGKDVNSIRIAIYNSKFPIFVRKLGIRIPNP